MAAFSGRKELYSSKISSAQVTSFAPCLIRSSAPRLLGEVMGPGTANTSLPASNAASAVISEPLRESASTTSVPSVSPAIIRLRCGNSPGWLFVPGGYSLSTSPLCEISRSSTRFSGGYTLSSPVATTAMVYPPQASAASWHTLSIPRASPLTTASPARLSSSASCSPTLRPYAVGTRVPTIATAGREASWSEPR
ncbi:hypothetical protein D3C73_1193300 [compost metagenome]